MKIKSAILSLLAFLTISVTATTPTLELITQPLYWHGAVNHDKGILYSKVPKIMNHTLPLLMAHWYHSPTYATNDKEDLNLISVYGVKVSVTKPYTKGIAREFLIDTSKSKQPKNFPFTIDQVVSFAVKAIREDFKDSKTTKIFISDGKSRIESMEPKQE